MPEQWYHLRRREFELPRHISPLLVTATRALTDDAESATPAAGRRPDLFGLVYDFAARVLPVILEARRAGRYIGTYFDFPNFTCDENGFPQPWTLPWDGSPIDYHSAFSGLDAADPIVPPDIASDIDALAEHLGTDRELRDRIALPNMEPPIASARLRLAARSLMQESVCRSLHVLPGIVPTPDQFRAVYQPLETALVAPRLAIQIWVPICGTLFSSDYLTLDAISELRAIPVEYQVARRYARGTREGAHGRLADCATHALVFNDYWIANPQYRAPSFVLHDAAAYPLESINLFFAALRLATSRDTGYAEIFAVPTDWALEYVADLPPLFCAMVRAFSDRLENWPRVNTTSVSDSELAEAALRYSQLARVAGPIRVAYQRLNRAFFRGSDEDVIIDATIALEALLLTDGQGELAHKLALRAAALLTKAQPKFHRTPIEVFRCVKEIYKARSAVVHGASRPPNQRREVAYSDGTTSPLVAEAILLLREILRVQLDNPAFQNAATIDEQLLLHALRLVGE